MRFLLCCLERKVYTMSDRSGKYVWITCCLKNRYWIRCQSSVLYSFVKDLTNRYFGLPTELRQYTLLSSLTRQSCSVLYRGAKVRDKFASCNNGLKAVTYRKIDKTTVLSGRKTMSTVNRHLFVTDIIKTGFDEAILATRTSHGTVGKLTTSSHETPPLKTAVQLLETIGALFQTPGAWLAFCIGIGEGVRYRWPEAYCTCNKFLPRDAMLVLYMLCPCVCLSVCVSVRLSITRWYNYIKTA